ncbi:hypothetical protein [Noviherbaspirillum saxi]|uniref:Uncharacterized protein n=1 Tax=Noviherbaspirillum saxi TaxID=2320863 RepID=A0A3A3FTC7_9BURK|nr:hypothetical protein [Noviherbaspirillum saxi]RJF99043.1 hypothetical protein D3871_11365 [Noviherbaspirillum saxi]
MSGQFKVGEIAIVQNVECELNGTECEVIEVYEPSFELDGIEYAYAVLCIDGKTYSAAQKNLRKKNPPAQFDGELRIMQLFEVTPIRKPEMEPV